MTWLLALTFVCGWAPRRPPRRREPDPVAPLLRTIRASAWSERSAGADQRCSAPDVASAEVDLYLRNDLLIAGAVKTTVRERDRAPLEGAPPGDGYSLVVEFFIETPGRARILTAGMDMRRPPDGDIDVVALRRRGGTHVGRRALQAAHRHQPSADRAQSRDHVRRSRAVARRKARSSSSSATTASRAWCSSAAATCVLADAGRRTWTAADLLGQRDARRSPFETAFVRLSPSDYQPARGCNAALTAGSAACATVAAR